MGVSSIFNRNGPFWHVRRKSQAPAFSPHHIKRMNRVAMDCTDKWIEDKLIPWAKEGKSFDVGKEMISVTLDAICKTAFEYEISEQEKKEFTQNCELVFREFFSRSTANPFRKIFGRLLPERRRALRAARSNHELAMSIVSNYRSLPNPTKGTLIDLIANQSFYKDDFELGADVVTYVSEMIAMVFKHAHIMQYSHSQSFSFRRLFSLQLVGGHDVRAFTVRTENCVRFLENDKLTAHFLSCFSPFATRPLHIPWLSLFWSSQGIQKNKESFKRICLPKSKRWKLGVVLKYYTWQSRNQCDSTLSVLLDLLDNLGESLLPRKAGCCPRNPL